jgi:hypothetical protein
MQEWIKKRSGEHEIEYVLSLDTDDDTDYAAVRTEPFPAGVTFSVVIGSNRGNVDAMNRGAEETTGDVLIQVSDDFGCPQYWDRLILGAVGGASGEWLLHVDDGIQAAIATLPIVSRALYERMGRVMAWPEYINLFSDTDLTEWSKRLGAYRRAPGLLFEHRHWSVGKSVRDATYHRIGKAGSQESQRVGQEVFAKRKAANFGVTTCTK